MSLLSVLNALRSIPPRRSAVRLTGFRPRLESLDERTLPSFSPAASYSVGDGPQAVATGDFNHDAKLDLAVVNYGANTVSVLLRTFDAHTCAPSGVNCTRCGPSPPDANVSTIASVAVEITEILLSSRHATHTSRPSGETVMPSAPAPTGMFFTVPVARSITLTLPETVFVT